MINVLLLIYVCYIIIYDRKEFIAHSIRLQFICVESMDCGEET